jgi:hypothetical protein
MPSFDERSSHAVESDGRFLREVLGPGTPRGTSLRDAAVGYRQRRRRGIVRRAFVVIALAAGFCGSALVFGDKRGVAPTILRAASTTDTPETTGSIVDRQPPTPGLGVGGRYNDHAVYDSLQLRRATPSTPLNGPIRSIAARE